MSAEVATSQRLFVGGLYKGIDSDDVKNRFSKFGKVTDVDIKTKKSGLDDSDKTFAYINICINKADLDRCKKMYEGTRWKGNKMSIQIAKENFLTRLEQERKEEVVKNIETEHNKPTKDGHKDIRDLKGGKPGADVEGKPEWIVGKFGRVLPVMTMRRRDQRKVVSVDPSTYCHTVKSLEKTGKQAGQSGAGVAEPDVTELTWQLENTQRVAGLNERIQGKFPKFTPPKRKKLPSFWLKQAAPIEDDPSDHFDFEVVNSALAGERTRKSKLLGHQADSGDDSAGSADTDEIIKSVRCTTEQNNSGMSDLSDDDMSSTPITKSENKRKRRNSVTKAIANGKISGNRASKKKGDKKTVVPSESDDDEGMSTDQIIHKHKLTQSQHVPVVPNVNSVSVVSSLVQPSEYDSGLYVTKTTATSVSKKTEEVSLSQSRFWQHSGNDEDLDVFDAIKAGKLHKLYKSQPIPQLTRPPLHQPKVASNNLTSESGSIKEDTSKNLSNKGAKKDINIHSITSGEKTSTKRCRDTSPNSDCEMKKVKKDSDKESNQKKNRKECSNEKSVEKPPVDIKVVKRIPSEKQSKPDSHSDIRSSVKKISKEPAENLLSEVSYSESDNSDKSKHLQNVTEKAEPKKVKVKTKKESMKKMVKTAEQHAASNLVRLQSVRERQQAFEAQKAAVKNALAEVDKKGSGKRIVFDSDNEDEEMPPVTKHKKPHQKPDVTQLSDSEQSSFETADEGSSSSSSSDQYEDCNDKTSLFKKTVKEKSDDGKTGLQLFEESEEESEQSEDDRFRIRPEYEGETGRKLMKVQSKFGNDPRFKLDQRFIDEDELTEVPASENTQQDTVEESLTDERDKALQILEGIVGRRALHSKPKPKTFRDVSGLHYDPDRSDHMQFELQDETTEKSTKTKEKKKKKKIVEEEEEKEELPEVSTEKYYEVSHDLSEELKNKASAKTIEATENEEKPFSLLTLFGNDPSIAENNTSDTGKAEPTQQLALPWQQPDVYDTSDEEDTGDKETSSHTDQTAATHNINTRRTFFFTENDPRFKEGLAFFSNRVDPDQMRAEWLENRPALVEAYRSKRKISLRRKKKVIKRNKHHSIFNKS